MIGFHSLVLLGYWMAHGILDQSRVHGNMQLEDIRELYFKDLWARSFFQNVTDNRMYCEFDMHDLIHDLVQSVAQGECFTVKSANTKDISENVRHLRFSEVGQNISTTLQKLNKVRTIAAYEIEIDKSLLHTCFARFKFLQVLLLRRISFHVLPSSIGTLKHVRYLDLTWNKAITELPSAICRLHSLQTLVLGACVNFEDLPRDICKLISLTSLAVTTKQTRFSENTVGCLKSLRFLFISECRYLTCLPRERSYLVSLRTLIIYKCKRLDLSNEKYQGTPLRLQQLHIIDVPRMVALPEWFQGAADTLQVLVIKKCENLEALPGWLTSFTSLRKLVLDSCKQLDLSNEKYQGTPLRLQQLHIIDVPRMVALPEWFQGAANTLQVLVIKRCENLEALPWWFTSFTSLRELVLDSCKKSLSLPEGIHSLTTLELKIINCLESPSYELLNLIRAYEKYRLNTSLTTSLLGCASKDFL